LGDANPLFVLRNYRANQLNALRKESFKHYSQLKADYFLEYEASDGAQNFLNATVNFPLLEGQKANLFKCFLPQAWYGGNNMAVSGFLHPEGVYDDPSAGLLRAAIYPRLRGHYQFQNQYMLFPIGHRNKYSINIYKPIGKVNFDSISNLFSPKTIDYCYQHDGYGAVGGIKNDEGEWDCTGHQQRILNIDCKGLGLFSSLYDEAETPDLQARLPTLHSQQLVKVLEKFSVHPQCLGDLQGKYYSTQLWNEVNSQKDKTIKRWTTFPDDVTQWVLSGPHFYLGTPIYKTPRTICTEKGHYDVVDLTTLLDNYLPRTNYIPHSDSTDYQRRVQCVSWIEEGEIKAKPVTEYYRVVNREMLSPPGERTLICSV
jgi:hypothetical protein